ncbi:MAG: DUF5666 domain-containing protein, partial [Thiohalomonadales bacterium]
KVRGEVVSDPIGGLFDVMNRDGVTITVMVDVDTQYFPKSATEADIKKGVMLKAVGTFDADTLIAKMIMLKGLGDIKPPMPVVPPMIKYDGTVEDIAISDPAKPELGGTLTVMGQIVVVTADTKIFKVSLPIEPILPIDPMPPIKPMPLIEPMPQPVLANGNDGTVTTLRVMEPPRLTLEDIMVGYSVMVMAYYDDKGVLTARIIEVKEPTDHNKVFGPITAVDEVLGTLTVAGVTVMVDTMTNITPMGTDLVSIKAALDSGAEMKAMAKGLYDATAGSLNAQRVAVHEVVIIM